ncbi:MAG: hypothetical protein A2W22_00150 [Candidatus Levybacteria bacterium RBG_16_35_11]|nr:MAG: hypothetical protein A2W22_00150 [Candidatus Levybacteria bacterium RBG_16_35_11]
MKNKLKISVYLVIPLLLLVVFLVIFSLNAYIKQQLLENKILKSPFSSLTLAKYPELKNKFTPIISAKGVVVMDKDSKVVLFDKNPNLRFSSASTTKIMTALTALSAFKLNDILTVNQSNFEGSVIGLKKGEEMTFENLLFAMLLPSGNDAALTIAQNYPGGEIEFIKEMNKNAEKLSLSNTYYSDPSGLDEENYTTPFDLARLASFSLANEEFKRVVATKEKFIFDTSGNTFKVENLNKLLGYDGVNGVKTGYTEEAGEVLVTSKSYFDNSENREREIIIVVMGSQDRFFDTENLLNLVSGNISYLTIHP